MTPVHEIIAWADPILRDCRAKGIDQARTGRFEIDRGWVAAARDEARCQRLGASMAARIAWWPGENSMREAEWNIAMETLEGLLRFGRGLVFGVDVRLVAACEPQLRFVAFRDPLIFGASA